MIISMEMNFLTGNNHRDVGIPCRQKSSILIEKRNTYQFCISFDCWIQKYDELLPVEK